MKNTLAADPKWWEKRKHYVAWRALVFSTLVALMLPGLFAEFFALPGRVIMNRPGLIAQLAIAVAALAFGIFDLVCSSAWATKRVSVDGVLDYRTRSDDQTAMRFVHRLRSRAARWYVVSAIVLALLLGVFVVGFLRFTGAEETAFQSLGASTSQEYEARMAGNLARLKEVLHEVDAGHSAPNGLSRIDIIAKIEETRVRLERVRADREALPFGPAAGNSSWTYALSVVSTKIGSVLLLIFGAKVLVSQCRYTLKLANFYESAADFIQALPAARLEDSEVLKTVLIPPGMELDKPPTWPGLEATEMIRAVEGLAAAHPSGGGLGK